MPWSTPKGSEGTPRAKIQASLETFLEAGAAKGYAVGEAGVTTTPKLHTLTSKVQKKMFGSAVFH